ncbi:MAG: Rne/Rng family ribonuclease [Acidobacteria bacterium]|nr:Rne/Rng family ribonuclease [Acidobacteriota bacterium]
MAKEMVVSSNPHETRVAILEDGLVSEIFFEREQTYSLAGSIYKGRVMRILPGMQSAFVNIGLERDAFLYVSDFLEGLEEYDQLMHTLEERTPPRGSAEEDAELSSADALVEVGTAQVAPSVAPLDGTPETSNPTGPSSASPPRPPQGDRGRDGGRGRSDRGWRYGRRGRSGAPRGGKGGIPDSKYARTGPESAPPPPNERPIEAVTEPEVSEQLVSAPEVLDQPVARILLPGESLAKYREQPSPSDSTMEIAGSHESPLEISRGNEAVEPVHEEEIAAMPVAALDVVVAAVPATVQSKIEAQDEVLDEVLAEADGALSAEPLEQEASEVISHPLAFTPRPFDLQAFAESSPEDMTAEEMDAAGEQVLREAAAESAGAGIDWESREETQDISGEMSAEESGEEISTPADNESGTPAESGEAPAGREGAPREAAVREGGRNPRFQRRGRSQARRGGPRRDGMPPREGLPPREDAAPPDPGRDQVLDQGRAQGRAQGRRPQRNGNGPREGQRDTPRDTPRDGQRQGQAPRPLIGDMLKEGQEIIVQIAKEPLGKKGARITSHVALPGRYVVYMPTLNHIGVSRKVSSDEERQRLKRVVLDAAKNFAGGFIVRTAGDGRSDEDIRQDVQYLTRLWLDIKAKAEKSNAPSLLHHDPDLVLRTLRDQLSPEYTTIWVDNEQVYEQILLMVQKFQPTLVGRVRLYTKEVPLFEETGVQDELNKALKPKVWLKSGGYIVINQTEALVAIDVNTGKFVGKSNRLEDTIVKTNLEAIQEIVRQIRLRDLGGIIVIDFIDMDERKNRAKVMMELEDAVRADRSPSKILSFNEFGLVALTRKRVRQSLERALCTSCVYCDGSGMVKSPATVSLEILSEAKKVCADWTGKQVTIRVNPEVGKTLKSTAASIIESIEEMTGKGVIIRNDPSVHMENFYFD